MDFDFQAAASSGEDLQEKFTRSLRCMSVVGGMYSETNGVTRILCDLANAVVRCGGLVDVYTASCKGGRPAEHLLKPPSRCFWTRGLWLGALSYAPELRRMID